MKVGVLSQWFAPEEATLPNSLVRQLTTQSDDVTVLTAFPSYPQGVIFEGYVQRGDYQEPLLGASVYRVQSFLSHDSSPVNRIRSFLSFSWATLAACEPLTETDVNYVYATPMTAAFAALWVKIRCGVPYVLHVQDLWPESVTNSGMVKGGLRRKILDTAIKIAMRPLYAKAAHVIAIAPSMEATLIKRGVPNSRISTVLNWEPLAEDKEIQAQPDSRAVIKFLYAGNFGVMQDVETIVRAAALLQDRQDIEIHLYGSGVLEDSLHELVRELEIKNVQFHGRVGKPEMAGISRQASYQFVTLKDRPIFKMTIPSKFQAAMGSGVPIITTVQGDLADICAAEGLGLTAPPEDPVSLAQVIRIAADLTPERRGAMAENCVRYHERELDPGRGISIIRDILMEASRKR